MDYNLIKINNLSGSKASIYTLVPKVGGATLFDDFILENKNTYPQEILSIAERIKSIGKVVGAREGYFKINEGIPGDGVCALYDDPNSNIRLYCIRYGMSLIVLGSGGYKSKSIKAFQENDDLKDKNYFIREISAQIKIKMAEKDLRFSDDYMDFEGDLTLSIED